MIPILFNATDTTFTTHGIGNMAEAISCEVTKDGMMYELQMTYPVTGKRFADIVERNIVVAKPDLLDNPQPFRIYRITKPIDGRISLYARHINYDMAGIPVSNFTATSAADFATKIKNNALVPCPFNFSTDIVDSYDLKIEEPDVMRSLLGGKDMTWQGVYGGDIVFNGYNVQLKQNGGQDRDITVRYGVDIVDAQMERDIAEVYTGIIPFYKGNVNNAQTETQEEIIVIGDVQNASGTFNYTKVQPVDISSLIQTENPSKAQVNAAGQLWLSGNDIGKTLVSLTLDYAQINNKVVQLYDYITVDIPKLGVTVKSKVIKTVFDVLKERYTSIDVGDNKGKLSRDLYDASRLKHGTLTMGFISKYLFALSAFRANIKMVPTLIILALSTVLMSSSAMMSPFFTGSLTLTLISSTSTPSGTRSSSGSRSSRMPVPETVVLIEPVLAV